MQRDLVERAMKGDAEAFAGLMTMTGDRMLAIAYRILRDVHLAEDAVQVALIDGWRDLPGLRDPDRFEPWITRLLVRACYRAARQQRRWRARIVELPLDGPGQPDSTLSVADRDQLERGFSRLSPDHRAIFILHHYLGWEQAEIARSLEIPIGTVKSRLHYATQTLRAALEADERAITKTERIA